MWNVRPGGQLPKGGPSQAAQIVELAVFLLLILPSLIVALFSAPVATSTPPDFAALATAIIVRDVALVGLIVFFVWRSGEARGPVPLARIGWDLRDAPTEVAIGVALFLPMTICAAFIDALLRAVGFSGPPENTPLFAPTGGAELLLAILLVVVVAISEETIFRGYLMLRFRNLTGSVPLAIVASSLIFAMGHGYQGASGLIAVGVIGSILAVVYAWRGNLVAVTTMHFIQDFIGIVLVPYLSDAR